jgi:ribose 1,5-bisphosphokinase
VEFAAFAMLDMVSSESRLSLLIECEEDKDMGRLFYMVGPSGAGKDTFIKAVRHKWPDSVLFAHRYITRSATAGGENHIELSEPEFLHRKKLGLFSVDWQAHQYYYGVGNEIDTWLEQGLDVVINGSREYLGQMQDKFGDRLFPVLMQVDEATLAKRLRQRGRETDTQINARLARARAYSLALPKQAVIIDNSGSIDASLQQFLDYYRTLYQSV